MTKQNPNEGISKNSPRRGLGLNPRQLRQWIWQVASLVTGFLRRDDKVAGAKDDEINDHAKLKELAELKLSKDPSISEKASEKWAREIYLDIKKRAYFYSKLNPAAIQEKNWYAAERDILKGITSDDLKEIEGRIRIMIQHENELLNHRIQWFLIINGFLLTATASLKVQSSSDPKLMLIILAIVGLSICISFWFSLGIGRCGVGRLADMWEHYRDLYYRHEEPTGCHQIGVLGWRSSKLAEVFSPWYALPWIFGGVWIVLLGVNFFVSAPNLSDKSHQIRVVQPNGEVVEIPIDTTQNSINIIRHPNGKIGIELPKDVPHKINKP